MQLEWNVHACVWGVLDCANLLSLYEVRLALVKLRWNMAVGSILHPTTAAVLSIVVLPTGQFYVSLRMSVMVYGHGSARMDSEERLGFGRSPFHTCFCCMLLLIVAAT